MEDPQEQHIRFVEDNDHDVWGAICAVFLDSQVPTIPESIKTLNKEFGIPEEESREVYDIITGPMMSYNFGSNLLDYLHLGLRDVLDALRGHIADKKFRMAEDYYAAFYWKAMASATKCKRKKQTPSSL